MMAVPRPAPRPILHCLLRRDPAPAWRGCVVFNLIRSATYAGHQPEEEQGIDAQDDIRKRSMPRMVFSLLPRSLIRVVPAPTPRLGRYWPLSLSPFLSARAASPRMTNAKSARWICSVLLSAMRAARTFR